MISTASVIMEMKSEKSIAVKKPPNYLDGSFFYAYIKTL